MTPGSNAYTDNARWKHARDFCPDIVFIKLGTNDSQPHLWKGQEAFSAAYQQMIVLTNCIPMLLARESLLGRLPTI